MPTKKPIIQSVIDEETYEKFLKITKLEKRSKSQLGTIAIEKFVKNYEEENGKIDIKVGNIVGQNNGIINMWY